MLTKGTKVRIISGSLKGEIGVIIREDPLPWKKSFWVDVCRKGKVSLWATRLVKRDEKPRQLTKDVHSEQV